VSDPVCVCGTCWGRDRDNDPRAWPTLPVTSTWAEGTVRVALPCVILARVGWNQTMEIESECEFFGHTLSEALAKAGRHRRAGAKYCRIAAKHGDDFVLPDGAGTR
jgi:hypothetical protein